MFKEIFSYIFSSDIDILTEDKINIKSNYRYIDKKNVDYLVNIKQKNFKNNIFYFYEYKGIIKKLYKNILIVSEIERLLSDIIKNDIYFYIKEFKIKNIYIEKNLESLFRRFNLKYKIIEDRENKIYDKNDLLFYLIIDEKQIYNLKLECSIISLIYRKDYKNGKENGISI